ncbi:TetR/AcrR family transcriptional regulator [Clostridium sp. D2Q-14]|uniref:TetR/AcrR family transcriptional regulator n=1 Tax=Anaeromonas gelatinilytica TaxID=2683194 RepID=UPI00193BC907|nr:TetR/AcrR family transcriptional regulator [Anaeromonas gelatinilytica]MBS4535646.1 TetR/AcrR family transcriptional regulator [Anaeromonas gelatinilytica]
MNKKEIQRQRIMNYFIKAAKKIILEEGIKNVTVRKVADIAGYSYATIYNYFKDLDTLILYCINDFLEDCYEYVQTQKHPNNDIDKIKSLINSYIEYFLKYPQSFQVIFIEDISVELPEEIVNNVLNPRVAILLSEEFNNYAKKSKISNKNIDFIKELVSNYIHGKLLFYIKRGINQNHKEFIKDINDELNYILS